MSLIVKDLFKKYGEKVVVDNISFTMEKPGVYALLGTNGAGKTTINHFLWLQVPHALPLTQCAANIDKLLFLEEKADVILHGHARDFDDIALMHHVRDGILEIIDGKTENDVPYEGFWGTAMQHFYEIKDGKHYQQPMHAIVYFPDRIK